MDDFQAIVENFFHKLEACNLKQRTIFYEDILPAFNTYLEVILLSFDASVGASDTINVKESLYNDFLDLLHNLQPHLEDEVQTFLKRLENSKEDRLRSLLRTLSTLTHNPQIDEEEILNTNMKNEEKEDLKSFLSLSKNVIEGSMTPEAGDCLVANLFQKMRDHRETFQLTRPAASQPKKQCSAQRLPSKIQQATETIQCRNMDEYQDAVENFFRKLQACNLEQRNIFYEDILPAFNTYLEEILFAFHVSVGASDTINVKELLYNDFLDLLHNLQPHHEDEVQTFLKRLEGTKEDHLRSLLGTLSTLTHNPKTNKEEILNRNMKKEEKKDLMSFLSLSKHVVEGNMTREPGDCLVANLFKKMREHRETFNFQKEDIEVDVINKRNLGRMIIRFVGHEGVDDKHGLRRLVQSCIDYLQNETEEFWRNALITIYDEDDNMFNIGSGKRTNQFICQMENKEPLIIQKTRVATGDRCTAS